jgi:hypothetical protein
MRPSVRVLDRGGVFRWQLTDADGLIAESQRTYPTLAKAAAAARKLFPLARIYTARIVRVIGRDGTIHHVEIDHRPLDSGLKAA